MQATCENCGSKWYTNNPKPTICLKCQLNRGDFKMRSNKKATRLPNGMVLIRTVHAIGGGIQRYKTQFGADRAMRNMGRLYKVSTWTSWECERCGHTVDSQKWAAKHKCK